MNATVELLPPELNDLRLPPGLELPANVIMTEEEAARFVREPLARFRRRRFERTGPVFIRPDDEPWAVRYTVWDCLSWLLRHRRTEMPERPRRASRKAAAQVADAAHAA